MLRTHTDELHVIWIRRIVHTLLQSDRTDLQITVADADIIIAQRSVPPLQNHFTFHMRDDKRSVPDAARMSFILPIYAECCASVYVWNVGVG